MRICNVKKLKRPRRTKKRRNQLSFSSNMLKILFFQLPLSVVLKLWSVWLSRVQMMKNLKIINIMKITQKIKNLAHMDQYSPFGVFLPSVLLKNMLLQSNGILDIKISSLLDTVHMISWSKAQVWSAAIQLKIQPGLSFHSQLSQESCV